MSCNPRSVYVDHNSSTKLYSGLPPRYITREATQNEAKTMI